MLDVETSQPLETLAIRRLSVVHAVCVFDGERIPSVKKLLKALKTHADLKSLKLSGAELSEQDVAAVCAYATELQVRTVPKLALPIPIL